MKLKASIANPKPPNHPLPSAPLHQRPLAEHHPHLTFTRRGAIVSTTLILSPAPPLLPKQAEARFDFNIPMVRPGQTIEQAMENVRGNARSLLEVKELMEAESWEEAQKELRKSSALLKQDIYTIIQSKPGVERPELRRLYSELFNGVSRLDYAARDRDGDRVRRCYEGMRASLFDILSRI